MIEKPVPLRIGKIVVELGFATPEQVKAALIEQFEDDLAGRPHRALGVILIDRGWLTIRQVNQAIDLLVQAATEARKSSG